MGGEEYSRDVWSVLGKGGLEICEGGVGCGCLLGKEGYGFAQEVRSGLGGGVSGM